MNFFTRITVLFYVTLVLFLSCFLFGFALQLLNINDITGFLEIAYDDEKLRMTFAIMGGVLLFINFLFYKFFSINAHRDKIIAFDNPSGRVSISLFALEDLIKRAISQVSEIKENKTRIFTNRKGLTIKIRLTLNEEVNIPEVTARLQEAVKRKVQDMVGLEEPVNVTVYIGKILLNPAKSKKVSKSEPEETQEPNIPFQGYRA